MSLGYEFVLTDEQCSSIDLQETDDFVVAVLLYKQKNEGEEVPAHQSIRANLNAPIVINVRSRKALQILLPKTERITLIRSID